MDWLLPATPALCLTRAHTVRNETRSFFSARISSSARKTSHRWGSSIREGPVFLPDCNPRGHPEETTGFDPRGVITPGT